MENPVTLPPGRARLFTQPLSTGEVPPGTMIGIELVIFISIGITRPPMATTTSGFNSRRFLAAARIKSMLSIVQRSSNWTLTPAVQPRFRSSSLNACTRSWISLSLGENGIKIPTRRIRRLAAHVRRAATPPPTSNTLMNSTPSHCLPPRLRIGTVSCNRLGLAGVGRERSRCPLWVKSRHLRCKTSCPLYPQ